MGSSLKQWGLIINPLPWLSLPEIGLKNLCRFPVNPNFVLKNSVLSKKIEGDI